MPTSLLEAVAKIAERHQLGCRANSEEFSLGHESFFISINGRLIDDRSALLYLFCRTTSWDYPGERTDVNDLLSTFLGVYLRCKEQPFSPALWDVYNPAAPVPRTEIYARYVTPQQPGQSIVTLAESSLDDINMLCMHVIEFQRLFSPLFAANDGSEGEVSFIGETEDWARNVAAILIEPLDDDVQYNRRTKPDWLYYRSVRRRISVLASEKLAAALRALLHKRVFGEELVAINRRLYVSARVQSAVSLKVETHARRNAFK